MTAICNQNVQPDGMTFDPASVVGDKIKEQVEYEGVRVRFRGYLGNARVNMQVDMGFASVVSSAPELVEYPALLDLPHPHLRGYHRETVVAEKVHAMVTLGAINSRMKDFYDLWVLSQDPEIDDAVLRAAIIKAFARRNTDLPIEMPIAFTEPFARPKQTQWTAFLRTNGISVDPAELEQNLMLIRERFWDNLRGPK